MKVLLAFSDSKDPIRRRFLKKGFGHVAVLIGCGKKTMKIEGTKNRLSSYVIDACIDIVAFNYEDTHTLLYYDAVFGQKISFIRRMCIFDCVSVACYLIGIKRVLTPYELYKHILKIGEKT